MDVSSPATPHYDSLPESVGSEFQSDAYLEYRRRVLEQLAEEKKNEAASQQISSSAYNNINSKLRSVNLLSNSGNDDDDCISSDKSLFDSQPSWDDSDINFDNESSKWSGTLTDASGIHSGGGRSATNDVFHQQKDDEEGNSLITWSEVDEHISKNIGRSNSSDALSSLDLDFSKRSSSQQRLKRRSTKRNSLKRKKYEQKDKLANILFDNDNYTKPERSYSIGSQSLQICYINQSCSSDDNQSDNETSKAGITATEALVSPVSSPRMALPR